jgi:hypothetical protein
MISPPTKEVQQVDVAHGSVSDQSLVVFVLDISGSMNEKVPTDGNAQVELPKTIMRADKNTVNRMECIQTAVHHQLENMRANYPNQRPVVITFCTNITIYFGADGPDSKVSANQYTDDFEKLYAWTKHLVEGKKLLPAAENSDSLIKVVDKLKPDSMTALGPAVCVGLAIASVAPGSKVIVCTDGAANQGMGSLDDRDKSKVADFYTKVGTVAKQNSSQVSVLSIRGTDCKMEMIGVPAEMTRGSVDVVNPLELNAQFSHLLARAVLGTGVSSEVRLDDRWGFAPSKKTTASFEIGSVTADTDLAFPFVPVAAAKEGDPPLVAQSYIRYTRADGATCERVSTTKVPISSDRDVCERRLNSSVVAMATIQHAANIAQEGAYLEARCNLIATVRMLQRAMKSREQQQSYIAFIKEGERLDGFMRIAQERSKLLGVQQAARDDTAARNIMQMKTCPLSLLQGKP